MLFRKSDYVKSLENRNSNLEEEIGFLKIEIKSDKDTITNLHNENKELHKELAESYDKYSILSGDIYKLESDKKELQNQLDIMTTKYTEIMKRIKLLEEEKDILIKDKNRQADSLSRECKMVNTLAEQNVEKDHMIQDLSGSFEAVTEGIFKQDNIECALLKTYQGWKYLWHDGHLVTALDNAECVNINWDRGERIRVDINR